MLQRLKLWRLASTLKRRKVGPHTYAAVVELGRIHHPRAVALLIEALRLSPGVARSAALELGRLQAQPAIKALAELLANPEVSQSAARALIAFGAKATDALLAVLKHASAEARYCAAEALGEIRDPRAVDPLLDVLQADPDFDVRMAAVRALGELKNPRALWTMVGIMKLRDESDPERQARIDALRKETRKAMNKIGDPLATSTQTRPKLTVQQVIEEKEKELADSKIHPRLIGDLSYLTEAELIDVLRELVSASEEISWAKLEQREPMLPLYFRTYDQRQQAACTVGQELYRRGGRRLLVRVLDEQLDNYAAIRNWWSELELLDSTGA